MFAATHDFSYAPIRVSAAQAGFCYESTYADVPNPPHLRPADAG